LQGEPSWLRLLPGVRHSEPGCFAHRLQHRARLPARFAFGLGV